MTDQHTLGPWSHRQVHRSDRQYIYAGTEDMPDEVAIAYTSQDTAADDEANARLIAAAPDLLEALEGVLLTEKDTHRQSDDRWSVFRQAAHRAIAKARGDA